MSKTKKEVDIAAPNKFMTSLLNRTEYKVERARKMRDDSPVGYIMWKTWEQECMFRGVPAGKYKPNTAKKLEKEYTLADAEDFVRAQFIMGVRHTYVESFHFNFMHLISKKCKQAYSDYLDSYDYCICNRLFCICCYYERWVQYRAHKAEIPYGYHTDDYIVKLLIYEAQEKVGETPYQSYDREKLAKKQHEWCYVSGIECLRWPGILESEIWTQFPKTFELLKDKVNEFKEAIYGESYGIIKKKFNPRESIK